MRVRECNCFQHVLGQLELIGKGNTFPWWANARISLDSPPDVPKLCGPTQQSRMLVGCVPDGPTRATCLYLWCMKWAHASAHVLGQLELIGKGNTLLWWAKARVSLDSPPDVPKLCGPTQQSRMLAHCVLDGPRQAYIKVGEMGRCECLGAIAFSMLWANSNSSVRATHSYGGPRQEFRLTALPKSPNYVGPHNSLAC